MIATAYTTVMSNSSQPTITDICRSIDLVKALFHPTISLSRFILLLARLWRTLTPTDGPCLGRSIHYRWCSWTRGISSEDSRRQSDKKLVECCPLEKVLQIWVAWSGLSNMISSNITSPHKSFHAYKQWFLMSKCFDSRIRHQYPWKPQNINYSISIRK